VSLQRPPAAVLRTRSERESGLAQDTDPSELPLGPYRFSRWRTEARRTARASITTEKERGGPGPPLFSHQVLVVELAPLAPAVVLLSAPAIVLAPLVFELALNSRLDIEARRFRIDAGKIVIESHE
jgi:hypothetical protein